MWRKKWFGGFEISKMNGRLLLALPYKRSPYHGGLYRHPGVIMTGVREKILYINVLELNAVAYIFICNVDSLANRQLYGCFIGNLKKMKGLTVEFWHDLSNQIWKYIY